MSEEQPRVAGEIGQVASDPPRVSLGRRVIRGLLLYLLPLCVIAGAGGGAMYLVETAPKARQRKPKAKETLVEVTEVQRTDAQAVVQVMGTVVAAQEVILQPRVSGEVVRLSPKLVPGGRFEADEFMLRIDPSDYELAVQRAQAQIAQCEYDLKMELGHQEIAKREWELLGAEKNASELDRELALRKPHLAKFRAALKGAEAALREAELDLERTTIRAPFSCVVTEENVDLGAQVTSQTRLATLVGTDAYWVRAAVPVDQLDWIRFPSADGRGGSAARIHQQFGTERQKHCVGRVVRLMGDLEPEGRMARVLISVRDPLRLDSPGESACPLLIGAYVNIEIDGREVKDVFRLPRRLLRDGGKVWIMNDERSLEIRPVDVVWRSRDNVLVRRGLSEGDRVIVSDLPAPVAGMKLTLGEGAAQRADSRPAGSPR